MNNKEIDAQIKLLDFIKTMPIEVYSSKERGKEKVYFLSNQWVENLKQRLNNSKIKP